MSKFPEHEHITNVCRIGQGAACCRYLTMSTQGWGCEKHTALKRTLDRRVEVGEMNARGDNCEGDKNVEAV